MMSPESKNQKIERRFSVFPTVIKIGSHALKDTVLQSKTRGVPGFLATIFSPKQPSSLKIDLKALILFFRTRYETLFALE